jgi:hypothetical protein
MLAEQPVVRFRAVPLQPQFHQLCDESAELLRAEAAARGRGQHPQE